MTKTVHLSLQALATILQVLNLLLPAVPDKYKPIVAGVIAIIQLYLGNAAHNSNPDGTPAATAYVKPAAVLLLALLIPGLLCAQVTPAPPVDVTTMFAVKTTAMNLHIAGANNAGTDVSASYTFLTKGTASFQAVTDNLLVPGNNFQGYYGGAGVTWTADKLFANTTLPKNTLQLYGQLEGGIARNVPPTGTATSKPSFYTHGGINYDPTHTGKFSINVIDGGFVYAPNLGYPNPASNGYTLSVGIKLGLWTKQ